MECTFVKNGYLSYLKSFEAYEENERWEQDHHDTQNQGNDSKAKVLQVICGEAFVPAIIVKDLYTQQHNQCVC